jgi:hypothetical protein
VSFDRYNDRDIADIEHPDGFLAEDIMLTSELANTSVNETDNVLACHGNLAATWTIVDSSNSRSTSNEHFFKIQTAIFK